MLRNNLILNTNNLLCQITDWKAYDIIQNDENENDDDDDENDDDEPRKKYSNNKKFIIRGYGVTENGNSICIHIDDFEPYFYFKIPQNWDNAKFNYFAETVKESVYYNQRSNLIKYGIVKKKEFYGFTNNQLFLYGIFVFKNESGFYTFKKAMKENKFLLKKYNEEIDFSKSLYETKVSPLLRFFHVQNIDPSGWIEIKKFSKNIPSKTRTQIDIKVSYKGQ